MVRMIKFRRKVGGDDMNKKNCLLLLQWLIKCAFSGIIALTVLSVCAYIYNYTGIHITNQSKATDYTWQENQRMHNMKEGFSFIKMDENGFNNPSVPESIDILLMGSSHMEAYQVAQNENCAYLLNEYLSDYTTYNIGISGHTLYRIADNVEFALKEFNPSAFLLIETNTIQLDVEKMKEVINGESESLKSHDSGILFYLQKIPAFKPIYNQLDIWFGLNSSNKRVNTVDNGETSKETVIPESYTETLKEFLDQISEAAFAQGVQPIIFYSPNEILLPDGSILYETNQEYFDIFKEACNSSGIIFIDMTEPFATMYKTDNVLAHGFSNTAVGRGHLNKYGHKEVAKTLVSIILEEEKK